MDAVIVYEDVILMRQKFCRGSLVRGLCYSEFIFYILKDIQESHAQHTLYWR